MLEILSDIFNNNTGKARNYKKYILEVKYLSSLPIYISTEEINSKRTVEKMNS